jgi:hypothetical protein
MLARAKYYETPFAALQEKLPFGALSSNTFLARPAYNFHRRDIVPLRPCCGWTSENSVLMTGSEAIGGFRSRALL